MTTDTPATMTPACSALVRRIRARRKAAQRRAIWKPRAERDRFIYDQSFENEIEAVAFFLAERLGKVPDFARPTYYTEHLRGQFLTHPNPLMPIAADKIAMRDYCALFDLPIRPLRLLATYDKPEDLVPADLPPSAMIKINDGCKMNILHAPGMPVTPFAYRQFLREHWYTDHWRRYAELHYRDIPKRILVEEALLPAPSVQEINIFCTHEGPYLVIDGPHRTALRADLAPLETLGGADHSAPLSAYGTEAEVNAMLETARLLSQNFFHSRIDFHRLGDRLSLCEITLSPGGYYVVLDTPEQERVRTALLDLSLQPEIVERGRKIARDLGYPTETSFGHFAGDPRISTGGQPIGAEQ